MRLLLALLLLLSILGRPSPARAAEGAEGPPLRFGTPVASVAIPVMAVPAAAGLSALAGMALALFAAGGGPVRDRSAAASATRRGRPR